MIDSSNTLIVELKIFLKSILSWLIAFGVLTVFFFSYPTDHSISVMVFNKIRHDLLPSNVELLATNPMSGFTTQVLLSAMLGFLASTPYFIYKIINYLKPALTMEERKAVFWTVIPFTLLFFSGALFSYVVLIPMTFKILYPFATSLGVVPFFHIDEFASYVFGMMMAVGIIFLLPIFMALLSGFRLIPPPFWLEKQKFASLLFLIVSAIITPDGTGVTMILLFIPLLSLYYLGYFFAKRFYAR